MSKMSFNAEYRNDKGSSMKVYLELYKFKEDKAHIIYCPSLDLSAYGQTDEEARKGFSDVFGAYINYCMSKKTLVDDLKKYGWSVKSMSQKKMKAPSSKDLLPTNKTLQDIIYNREYEKVGECVEIPSLA